MVVIGFDNGGWGVSNDAKVVNTPKVIISPSGETSFRDMLSLEMTGFYEVSGKLSGTCKIAIRDSVSGELKCYKGEVVNSRKVRIISEDGSEWLAKI